MDDRILRWMWAAALTFVLSCNGASDGAESDAIGGDVASDLDIAPDAPPDATPITGVPTCDPLLPEVCALPWPSSYFLVPDEDTATGYRVRFGPTSLPANHGGEHVEPTRYQRFDGFGVGTPLVAYFPELDPADLPDETRIAETLEADSPVRLFEQTAEGGLVPVPCWAEVDLNEPEEDRRALLIRPAVLLRPATRYVVVLRHLPTRSGGDIAPSPAFGALRDGSSGGTEVEDRQAHFDELFALLGEAGLERDELTLAWDFVTASEEVLHGDMLHMRDEAFATVEATGIPMEITTLTDFDPVASPHIAFEAVGAFEVPDYTEPYPDIDAPAWLLHRGPDGLPEQNGTRLASFRVRVPWTALDGTPHGLILHGHGLLGTHGQIGGSHYSKIAHDEHFVIAGCDMIGMSEEDVLADVTLTADLSHFPILSERLHQGLLEHLLLVRAFRDSFDALPEMAARGVLIDDDALHYSGISQGGIYGASFMALSLDVVRGHLGVPGNNYSTLLRRSVDFEPFLLALTINYPDSVERSLLLGAVQVFWDTVDPVSYYRHISADPFPGTPPHAVLLASATGDWQVPLVTNELITRSDVGVALMPDYGKEVPLVEPTPYPHAGSALVNYSFGNPWPPPGNLPPAEDELGDPHGKPRKLDWHNAQMVHFFRTGEVIDVCGGDGCTPD